MSDRPIPIVSPGMGGFTHCLGSIAERAASADRGERSLKADIADMERVGLLRDPLPPVAGGRGIGTDHRGTREAVAILRALGRANLSVARIFEGHVNAVKLIALYADAAVREAAFAKVRRGLLLGVWGADGAAPVTLDDTGLHGTKRFASGLGLLGAALITAKTDAGTQLLLVPVDDVERSDPTAWTASGMRATASGTYRFDGIGEHDIAAIGQPDDLFREPHFEGGVWRYCAAHLGGAEALYDELLSELARRGQSDAPIQQVRIAEAAIACESARLWIENAADRVERPHGSPAPSGERAAAYALLAREATQAACLGVIGAVEQAVGTAAFMEGAAIERMRRDLGLFVRQAAPDAKRARAVRALTAAGARAEEL